MRPLPRAWFPCVCVMSLLLVAPTLAGAHDTKDKRVLGEGNDPREAQLIGWSEDEQRFVFRVYADATESESMNTGEEKPKDPWRGKDGFCKGYVNHEGKPFKGSLELQVFEQSGRVALLPIQDDGGCTPPKKAAQRLAEAKQKLAELGIRLEHRGAVLLPKAGEMERRLEVKEGARAPYTLEFIDGTEKKYFEDEGVYRYQGTMRLLVHSGGRQRVLWEKKLNREIGSSEAYEMSLSRVDVSPSGGRLVLLLGEESVDMRLREGKLWMEAVLDVPGGAAAKAK